MKKSTEGKWTEEGRQLEEEKNNEILEKVVEIEEKREVIEEKDKIIRELSQKLKGLGISEEEIARLSQKNV